MEPACGNSSSPRALFSYNRGIVLKSACASISLSVSATLNVLLFSFRPMVLGNYGSYIIKVN